MITKEAIKSFREINRILVKAEDFIYILPHPELRSWISNYTITFPNKNMMSDNYTVIPHGSATLVFSCNNKGIHGELFGTMTKPVIVGKKANLCNIIFIVEFQPAGLSVLTGIKQKELIDKIVPFETINLELNRLIVETLKTSDSINELINNVNKLFLLNQNNKCPNELQFSIKKIIDNIGNITVKELANEVFYSERQLNRIYEQYLGMNIKSFSRLVRVNKAIKLMYNPNNNVTDVCNLSGFYDLPHFIHDFKSVCGLTPQEYRHNMSDFYSEIAKF